MSKVFFFAAVLSLAISFVADGDTSTRFLAWTGVMLGMSALLRFQDRP